MTTSTNAQSLENRYQSAVNITAGAIKRLGENPVDFPAAKIERAIASLPLDTEQYNLAYRRIENAVRYWNVNELGAASWELTALQKQVIRLMELPIATPRRRSFRFC